MKLRTLNYCTMYFITDETTIRQYINDKVDTLLVDFDDTLVDYKSCENQALRSLFDYYQIDIQLYSDIHNVYNDINNRLWPLLEQGKMSIIEIRKKRFELMSEKVPFNDDPLVIDSKYLEFFVNSTVIIDSNLSAVRSLKKSGYNIMITTNGIREVQLKRIKKVGLKSIVNGVITSEDVEKAKPSPLMFETALQYLSSTNTQACVIGDSL